MDVFRTSERCITYQVTDFHAPMPMLARIGDTLASSKYDQNKNFRPTKCIPLPFDFPNGSLLVQRTSASVGVSAIAIGVGTRTFNTCSIAGARSMRTNIPPLLIFSDSALPSFSGTLLPCPEDVISYRIGLRSAARSL